MRAVSVFIAAASVVTASAAIAHDFWLQPSAFRVARGQPIAVSIMIGDPDAAEPWELEWRKVVAFQDFGPAGIADLQDTLRPLNGAKPSLGRADATVRLTVPGTHILAFTSNHAVNDLPAAEFNAYAEHEGLAEPLAQRRREGRMAANGREIYSRRAKALIQVGPTPSGNATARIGQTLELVPERNPYALKPSEPLRLRVWFHGAPLAGASVVLERLGPGAKHGDPVLSDKQGYVSFPTQPGVAYKANVVWSYAIVDPRAEYETIFCSLVFGGTGA